MASSRRPRRVQGVDTEFALRSNAFLWSSRWHSWRPWCMHCVSTALALRFHDVLSLRWRFLGKTETKSHSFVLLFIISALASDCENGHVENV